MSPTRVGRWEAAIRAGMAFHKAYNLHDAAGIMLLMTDDCQLEISGPAPDGTAHSGREAVSLFWQDCFRQTPTVHMEIEEIFSVGLRCVMRWRRDWTDSSAQSRHVRGVDILELKEGLITQQLSYVKG